MSAVEFVTVRHPDVEVPATVARTALPYLAGWAVVDEAKPVSSTKRTRTRASATAGVPPTEPDVADVEPSVADVELADQA